MPRYTHIHSHIELQANDAGRPTFVCGEKNKKISRPLGKTTPARGKTHQIRQEHFYRQMLIIRNELHNDIIPVYLVLNGKKLRLDKGCVGHAVADGFFESPMFAESGYVEEVRVIPTHSFIISYHGA